MSKRAVFFSTPYCLSLKYNQMVICTREMPEIQKKIPIEDLGFVVLEHQQSSVTLPLLNALCSNNVVVILCGNDCMPHAMLSVLDSNSTQGETYRAQVEAGEPLKKGLWKQVVECKIRNQAQLLDSVGRDGNILKPYYMNVKSGDVDNREGIAARLYWAELFGTGFTRSREGEPPNNLLNYGYTILRAGVARALTASGLLPAFGIFHRNRYNAFPLADDIMEPYRPFVDMTVFKLFTEGQTDLTKENKSILLRVLFCDTTFGNSQSPLDVALTTTTASLAKCFAGKLKKISFPTLYR